MKFYCNPDTRMVQWVGSIKARDLQKVHTVVAAPLEACCASSHSRCGAMRHTDGSRGLMCMATLKFRMTFPLRYDIPNRYTGFLDICLFY
ncbi:hypothetical protein EYC84_004659 [Monilinia fructicola]|uniref:Uncharacterized protein n=1 Tax=Monilinia fructicola TaxID=38448 RepID=A0A5M9K3K2_MONFR|nr:hypothetical protein EYC84_004659 [Monilinia fructicola]